MIKRGKIIICLIMLIILFSLLKTSIYAADGKLTASVKESSNKITVTIKSTEKLGAFKLTCSGANAIEATSLAGGAGNGNVINGSSTAGVNTLGYFVFNVPDKDTKVSFSVSGCEDPDMQSIKIDSTSVTLKAKTSENKTNTNDTQSSNAKLQTLGITGKSLEYNFKGFNKDKEEYEATKAIPSTVDSIQITAITAEKKAKIKISGKTNSVSGTNKATGNIDLEVGTNTIKIVVTAPDGKTTKTYSIRVTKLATEDEKPGNVIDDEKEVDLFLKSLSIDGLTLSPEFSSNVFTYETTINMDENDLNEVKVNAEANNSNAKIEITGNTNLVEGENLINIIVKEEGTSNQTVYQITVNKVSQKSEVLENSNKISKEKIIIAGGIAVIIIVIAVWIIIMKKNKDSYYDYEENDEEQEDTLYNYDNDNEDYNEPYSQRDNLVEELFQKKNKVNNEELNIEDKKTLEEIQKENDRIFKKNVEDESENSADEYEKRKKGKHF